MFAKRTQWRLEPNSFTVALQAQRDAGRTLLDLTVSNPTQAGFTYDRSMLHSLADERALKYDPQPTGMLSAREAVVDYYAKMGERVAPDRIVLTTSTSEAYSFVFRLLCEPGDEVLIAQPSYPLFEFLADICDVNLRPYELVYDHGWQVDFHSLQRGITPKTRAVVVVHPNNPTGSYVKQHEISQLNAICRDREMAIIADEVFLDYPLTSAPHQTFAANDDALTFTLSGVSKISALPQMKLGWMVISGPEEIAREAAGRMEVIADTYLSLNTPTQLAAECLLRERKTMQPQISARVLANLAEVDRQLASHASVRRLEVEGGWYVVLRVPATNTDDNLTISLIEQEGVIVHPGHFFDFHADGFLVLSLITPEAHFSEGLTRVLARFN